MLALVDTTDKSFTAEWVVAYVFLALSPAVLAGVFVGSFKKTNNRFPLAKEYPWFRIIAALVAFVAWVIALPSSPIFDWGTPAGFVQFLVLVVTTIGLAVLGGIWDKSS